MMGAMVAIPLDESASIPRHLIALGQRDLPRWTFAAIIVLAMIGAGTLLALSNGGNGMEVATLAMLALIGFAAMAAIWLTARATLNSHRSTVETLYLLGGSDDLIAGIVQRAMAKAAMPGAVAGLALGIVALFLPWQSAAVSGATEWALLIAIPIIGVIVAGVSARLTVLRWLGRLP